MTGNSFGALDQFTVGDATYDIFRLDRVDGASRLPYSLKVLLENLLRNEDGHLVTAEQVRALAAWDPHAQTSSEIQFTPARVLMQDFTGVPCVVDLVAMRDAMTALGGDPQRINPLIPTDLVIDHSVIADMFGRPEAFRVNAELEFERNHERYELLRWAQQAFDGFRVVPPDTGICHQVNLEYLARVVFTKDGPERTTTYPDTLVGTDSHTPMVNGLGVLGWGVGGIEAEAEADEHADPAGGRVQAHRRAERRHHRHRLGAHRGRAVAPHQGSRQVCGLLRARRRQRATGHPSHPGEHEPRVRLDGRHLPH